MGGFFLCALQPLRLRPVGIGGAGKEGPMPDFSKKPANPVCNVLRYKESKRAG
jgi:hypothetical protein